jgi:hypothetical protein
MASAAQSAAHRLNPRKRTETRTPNGERRNPLRRPPVELDGTPSSCDSGRVPRKS